MAGRHRRHRGPIWQSPTTAVRWRVELLPSASWQSATDAGLAPLLVENPLLGTPTVVQTAAQRTAVIYVTVPRADIQRVMGPAIGEVMAAVAAQGIAPAGLVFTYHLRNPSDVFDFEVGVPVASPVAAIGRVGRGALPAATVARAAYSGPYEGPEAT
jgi:effector-binding domain-containing protein